MSQGVGAEVFIAGAWVLSWPEGMRFRRRYQCPRSRLSRSLVCSAGLYVRGDLRRVDNISRVGVICVVKGDVEIGGGGGFISKGRERGIVGHFNCAIVFVDRGFFFSLTVFGVTIGLVCAVVVLRYPPTLPACISSSWRWSRACGGESTRRRLEGRCEEH